MRLLLCFETSWRAPALPAAPCNTCSGRAPWRRRLIPYTAGQGDVLPFDVGDLLMFPRGYLLRDCLAPGGSRRQSCFRIRYCCRGRGTSSGFGYRTLSQSKGRTQGKAPHCGRTGFPARRSSGTCCVPRSAGASHGSQAGSSASRSGRSAQGPRFPMLALPCAPPFNLQDACTGSCLDLTCRAAIGFRKRPSARGELVTLDKRDLRLAEAPTGACSGRGRFLREGSGAGCLLLPPQCPRPRQKAP